MEDRLLQEDESIDSSGEEEERVEIHPWPSDISIPEHIAGPHIRMQFGISEKQDEAGGERYVAKRRISQTSEIICDRGKWTKYSET